MASNHSGYANASNNGTAASRSAASLKATTAAATLISGSSAQNPTGISGSSEAPLDPAIKYFHPPPGRFGVSGGSGGGYGAELVEGAGSGGGAGGSRKAGSGSSSQKRKANAGQPDTHYHTSTHPRAQGLSREASYPSHYNTIPEEHSHSRGMTNDNDFLYNQFHAGSGQGQHTLAGQAIPKVRETMNKSEENAAGDSRGVKYFVDFDTLPLTFIIEYLNRNLIPVTFGKPPSIVSASAGGHGALNIEEGMNGNTGEKAGQATGAASGEAESGAKRDAKGDVWDEEKKACDPKQLFAVPASSHSLSNEASPSQADLNGQPNPNNANYTKAGVSGNARRGGTRKSNDSRQSGQLEGDPSATTSAGRRRHTNTSMTAAVIEESIMMAQQEEEKRAKVEEAERRASGGGSVHRDAMEVDEPVEAEEGEARAGSANAAETGGRADSFAPGSAGVDEAPLEIDSSAVDETEAVPEEKPAPRGRAGKKRKASERDGSAGPDGPEEEDRSGRRSASRRSEGSPKPVENTLRRSGRKPLPKGAPLATVHKQTRINFSPTPSITSSDSDYVAPGYQAILCDVEQASQILRDRARDHWCETLKAGMMNPDEQRLKLANGGQVPTWNPTMLSMVDTGPAGSGGIGYGPAPGQASGMIGMHGAPYMKTGGIMKEADIIVDFLYTLKVGNRQLKVAHLPSLSGFPSVPM